MVKNYSHSEVIVIGGGPAGLSVSAVLAANGVKVTCIDRDSKDLHLSPEYDGRTTAISYGSRNVLDHAGVWTDLKDMACPIRDIRILDGTSPVLMQFLSSDMKGKNFGWIVENKDLRAALYDRLDNLETADHLTGKGVSDIAFHPDYVEVKLEDGTNLTANLLVGADGRGSLTRKKLEIETRDWVYDQQAHICVVHHENPHDHIAYEHFREEGPFAILPMSDNKEGTHRSAVVWSDHRAKRRDKPLSDEAFLAAMQTRFPDHYGKISLGKFRALYPLGFLHAEDYIGPRTALIAEAVHVMHPIAGQGLNMSLRDAAAIAELVIEAKGQEKDIGAARLLKDYERWRRLDNAFMLASTDGLTRLYSQSFPPLRFARKLGVRAIAAIPPAKKFFMSQAMGLNGRLPKFVREAA